ncbi:sensor histidine kinase [Teredinibacter waterburyi]|uniref:sensor histidine kinase n=1 Tax=Teredinibacter waterburyi TaxID=1500538 RepID=UPI00165FB3F0|nr:HAMP domain-containing sensor histidine kinase [Teredinibacter waterburyi]
MTKVKPMKATTSENRVRGFGFHRLFWRIFLSFWLSSIFIMLATTYVITEKIERADFTENYTGLVKQISSNIIERYERGEVMHPRLLERELRQRFNRATNHPPDAGDSSSSLTSIADNFGHAPKIRMTIFDDQGKQIFGWPNRNLPQDDVQSLNLLSNAGNEYQVVSVKPPVPLFFKHALRRFTSVQLVIILIVSSIVSAVLSWSISRPLKKLGRYSRDYAQGNTLVAVDKKLLQRRDELGDLATDMAYMTSHVNATLQAQQQLLHHVSHELRAPLARLQASVGLVEEQLSDSTYTSRIHGECARIDSLIQQILDYSRLNKTNESKTDVDLVSLVAEVKKTIQLEYPEKEIELDLKQESVVVPAYQKTLQSALENIVRNACKYTPAEKKVDITLRQREDSVTVCIKDYGEGVDADDIVRLTQPFYRAGNQMHTQGFGLGLSIAEKALHKHRGQLLIENQPRGGLCVSCTLPIS